MPVDTISPILAYVVAAMIAASPAFIGPQRADAYALVGAMGGVLLVLVGLSGRPRGNRIFARAVPVIISGIFVGGLAPGLIAYHWFAEYASKWTWHVWMFTGFGFGICGQTVVKWLVDWFDRSFPAVMDAIIPSFFNRPKKYEEEEE